MDKDYKKEGFKNLSIKSSVADKFIRYSKDISKSRSMTLLLMLEFFENNHIAPSESLGPRMQTLEASLKKRINALIAIVKDIEQQQTLPTKAMLEALFEGLPIPQKKQILPSIEQAFQNSSQMPPKSSQPLHETDHKDIRKLLHALREIAPPFGKKYWRLEMSSTQIVNLKKKYHVYHD